MDVPECSLIGGFGIFAWKKVIVGRQVAYCFQELYIAYKRIIMPTPRIHNNWDRESPTEYIVAHYLSS